MKNVDEMVERLRKPVCCPSNGCDRGPSLAEALRDRREAADMLSSLARDAERYRHWRALWCAKDDLEALNALGPEGFETEEEWDAILDTAIDSAMKGGRG